MIRKKISPKTYLVLALALNVLPLMAHADADCKHKDKYDACIADDDIPGQDAKISVDAQGRIDGVTPLAQPAPASVPGPAPAGIGPGLAPRAQQSQLPECTDENEEGDVGVKCFMPDDDDSRATTYHTRNVDLTPSDLSRIFKGQTIKIETMPRGSVTFREAFLTGMIFNDCAQHELFKFEGYDGERGTANEGIKGFMITDPDGQGEACMAAHRRQHHVCTKDSCTPLRALGASLDTKRMGDGEIRFCYTTPSGTVQCDGLGEEKIDHKSRRWLMDQARAKHDARLLSRKEHLMYQVSHCLNRDDDRVIGRLALASLAEMGERMDDWARRYDSKDFESLRKLVNSEDADVDEVMDKLAEYAGQHPEKVEAIAKLYYDLALKQTKKPNATAADWKEADRIISEAEKLEGLKKATKAQLKNYHTDITVGMLQAMSQNGISNIAPQFWPLWQNTMQQLQNRVMSSCFGGYGSSMGGMGGFGMSASAAGGAPDMAGCQNAMTALQTTQSIPQQANQREQQRFQFLQQMQAQMMNPTGYSNPAMGTMGMQGTPGFFGAAPGGMNMLASSPMMGMPGTTPMMGASPTGYNGSYMMPNTGMPGAYNQGGFFR